MTDFPFQDRVVSYWGEITMKMDVVDTTGIKAPHAFLEIVLKSLEMKRGDILDIQGDSPSFERNVEAWCDRLGNTIVSVVLYGSGRKDIRVRF